MVKRVRIVSRNEGEGLLTRMIKVSQVFIRLLIDLIRIPFDLIEGESELVSEFNLEYYRRLFIHIFLI